ncbi:2-hydroxy-1,4-benzoquinone reductase [Cupriavidus laharis]|uniref:2-hydroxy-1,4-benzoquinone reductase n=1 Tax=Cupriavidus laharis TaxID=151654 RepID=A0ABN7ZF48_9BURK|nr:NAD(P)H-dependent oxidoreductase [Cupriavidus laharis]CAG9183833.1 2-hydroxy-1,4-benzoquinone reductase [Cupriavidus laharis]
MRSINIAVLVGSLRKESLNNKLARAIAVLAPADFAFQHVRIDDLPPYNQEDDAKPAESVARMREQIAAADGLMFVTPEYNRSIPGVLKNAIDHGSRPFGKSVWTGKPGGVIGISPSPLGTAIAQQHLRSILSYLDVRTIGQPEVYLKSEDGLFDEAGEIQNHATRQFLESWMSRYIGWIRQHAAHQ